jgi:hypothetical protein
VYPLWPGGCGARGATITSSQPDTRLLVHCPGAVQCSAVQCSAVQCSAGPRDRSGQFVRHDCNEAQFQESQIFGPFLPGFLPGRVNHKEGAGGPSGVRCSEVRLLSSGGYRTWQSGTASPGRGVWHCLAWQGSLAPNVEGAMTTLESGCGCMGWAGGIMVLAGGRIGSIPLIGTLGSIHW